MSKGYVCYLLYGRESIQEREMSFSRKKVLFSLGSLLGPGKCNASCSHDWEYIVSCQYCGLPGLHKLTNCKISFHGNFIFGIKTLQ